jgi:RNA polymerase sigma-70 factor (ECF subfamily)
MIQNLESTATLLAKVRNGDGSARERLCSINLPILTRWAHGRLPTYARNLSETDDMVQTCLIKCYHLTLKKDPHSINPG